MFASRIYKHSPLLIAEGLITARDCMRRLLREEKHFRIILEALKTQDLSSPALQLWHLQQLSELLNRAQMLAPYYQRLNIWPEAQGKNIFK